MEDQLLQKLYRRFRSEPDNGELREQYAVALRRTTPKPHYALIACIDSNLEALEAVLSDIQQKGLTDILCLGGMVRTGPNPIEVIDLVRDHCQLCLDSWMEEGLRTGFTSFNRRTASALDWARKKLTPTFFSGSKVRRRWNFLQELPAQHKENGYLFLYGTPDDPIADHLLPYNALYSKPNPKLERFFAAFDKVMFHAQTHLPGIYTSKYEYFAPGEIHNYLEFDLPSTKYIVNVGSVGQPRDRDPRAGWVEVLGNKVFFHRVPYDVEKTVAKITKIKQLDKACGLRLLEGL